MSDERKHNNSKGAVYLRIALALMILAPLVVIFMKRPNPKVQYREIHGQLQDLQATVQECNHVLAVIPSFDRSACEAVKVDESSISEAEEKSRVQSLKWNHNFDCEWCRAEERGTFNQQWNDALHEAVVEIGQLDQNIDKLESELTAVEVRLRGYEAIHSKPADNEYLLANLLRKDYSRLRDQSTQLRRRCDEQYNKISAVVLQPEK